jgi:hypothetical protein
MIGGVSLIVASVGPLIRIAARAARRPSQLSRFRLNIDFSLDEVINMLNRLYGDRSKEILKVLRYNRLG